MDMNQCKVIFQPSARRGMVPKGVSILEAARRLGVSIEALCGGKGACGKCVVRIEESGEISSLCSSQSHVSGWQPDVESKFICEADRQTGHRLSCAATILDDVLVFVPEASRAGKQVVSKKARDIPISLNPALRIYQVTLDSPSASSPTGDFDRLIDALANQFGLKNLTIDVACLRELSGNLRQSNWTVPVSIWKGSEIMRVRPGRVDHAYGVAIDVGTTTVAAYLCDMTTGDVVNNVSM